MTDTFRYQTPAAFRAALKERFGQIARAGQRYSLDELQRQFAYDRALARLFSSDAADRWVLKGAGALLARLATARHSKDIDVFFNATDTDVDDAVDALRAARLGPTSFATFHIDVVVGTAMTGTPGVVAPLTPLHIEGLVRPHYRVFPVVDHLADKLCAIIGTHTRGRQPAGSTRVKDLVDIAIIATTQAIEAKALRIAVATNAGLRRLDLPKRFTVPDPLGWAARYPRVAAEAPGHAPDYDTAVQLASQVFNPVLNATANGAWDPSTQAWTPHLVKD